MQALTVIHYGKVVKNIRMGSMYYGAFELGKIGGDGLRHVNILDMSACGAILDWTNAAESFIKGGSGSQIGKLYRERVRPGREEMYSTKTSDRLCDLTNCLNASRGKAGGSEKGSIQKAYEYFKSNYSEMRKGEKQISEIPLLRLFDKIEEDVKIFDRKCYVIKDDRKIYLENTATGMAAVQWAINKSLTQQGFTALEETIKTYICEACQIPTDEELFRDTIVGSTVKFMGTRYNSAKKNQKKTNQNQGLLPDADSLKELCGQELESDSEFMDLKGQERAFYLQKVEELIDNLPVELVNLTSDVARYRNSLNHFGFQKEETKYTKLQDKLKELYEKTEMLMKMEQVVWEDSCLAAENPCDQ